MTVHGHYWAIVLAGGEGGTVKRLDDLYAW